MCVRGVVEKLHLELCVGGFERHIMESEGRNRKAQVVLEDNILNLNHSTVHATDFHVLMMHCFML
jgi:hypothetical protein